MTKLTQAQKERYIELYQECWDTIDTAYKTPSLNKIFVYGHICTISRDMDGTLPRVITHNPYHFTTAFRFWRYGRELLRVDTANNIYMFYTDTLEEYKGI